MGVYTKFKDGLLRETTFGTSVILQATNTHLWGVIGEKAIHPSPVTSMNYRATGVNALEVPAGELYKGRFDLLGMYAIGMQNGVLLESVMGASTTVGADPYTHTIKTPTDGSVLPSFTIQHERTGTGTDWAVQFLGCKVAGLLLTCGYEQKYLIARVDWIAQKAIDPGFVLDNDPALPATATTTPYHFNNMTRTLYMTPEYAGDEAIDGLTYMELTISPDMTPIFTHKWDAGTYTGRWLYDLIESPRRKYSLVLEVSPGSDNMWDELIATGNTKNIIFKWTKSANDYIQLKLEDCQFISHEITTPEVGLDLIERVEIEPRHIEFEVKDSISGDVYGE